MLDRSQQRYIGESSATLIADRFVLFSLFWGWATLIDLGKWWAKNLGDPISMCVFASACLVCLRPSSAGRLVLLVSLNFLMLFWKLPWISNHGICSLFASLVMLVCLVPSLTKYFRKRRLSAAPVTASDSLRVDLWCDWFQRFAPVLRWQVVLAYAIAAFHKINTDFFHPEKSCAIVVWQRVIEKTPWAESLSSMGFIMPWVALATELALPLMLLRSRNRLAVIVIGLSFHLFLGLAGFFRFSSLVTALYVLFLPDWVFVSGRRTIDSLRNTVPSFSRKLGELNLARIFSFLTLVVAVWAFFNLSLTQSRSNMIAIREFTPTPAANWSFFFQALWLIPTIGILAYLGGLLCVCESGSEKRPRIDRLGWLTIFPMLFALNGLSPYLGLKTDPSLSMFSNLRTVGNDSYHLVVRSAAQLIPDGNDVVSVLSTSDPVLDSLRDKNYRLAWIELCSYVHTQIDAGGDFQLKFVRSWLVTNLRSVKDAREVFEDAFWLKRKLVRYRPVSQETVCPCNH